MECADIIRTLFPEFSAVSDETLQTYITIFGPLVSKRKFRDKYNLALAYLVAHKMAMDGLAASDDSSLGTAVSVSEAAAYSAAGIASVKDGESSISFSTATSSSSAGSSSATAEYEKTVYGLQYLAIRNSCIMPITVRR